MKYYIKRPQDLDFQECHKWRYLHFQMLAGYQIDEGFTIKESFMDFNTGIAGYVV